MKTMLALIASFSSLVLSAATRDPFWPIGYQPNATNVTEAKPVMPTFTPPEARPLSDEELRALALEESENIRKGLKRDATAIFNNQVHAYVKNKWVTVGDSLMVEVHGRRYRLVIKQLTPDNIELEAHREAEPNQP